MKQKLDTTAQVLAQYIREHGYEAMVLSNGRIAVWWVRESNGREVTKHKTLEASDHHVRHWLGY